MHQQLVANALFEWAGIDGTGSLKRLLWMNAPDDTAVVINLPAAKQMPQVIALSSLIDALKCGEARVLQHDPYIRFGPSKELSQENQDRATKAWTSINELISLGPTAMFDAKKRSSWIEDQIRRDQFSKPYLYELLRRYWQGGQTRQALQPRYHRSGGKGQERLKQSDKKKGRPLKSWTTLSRPLGINVDEQMKSLLQKGGIMFYESSGEVTFREAYELTLNHFFHIGYEVLPSGKLMAVLPEVGSRPTFAQFRYWYGKGKREVEATIARAGDRQYLLKSRAVLGNATRQAFGPGSEYQFDSTIGDINLVSRIDRTKLLGRPILYVVIDTFSRMVVGFYVGLENASWRTAIMALENVTADKAEFCRTLGIPGVTSLIWPTSHLPASIIADRGELIGAKSDVLTEVFGVEASTTPPYRPDWKPFVERHFGLINSRLLKSLPGASKKKERGSRDTRLDAVLDLPALRKILALDFIAYNTTAALKDYPMDKDMVAAGVKPHPIDLWNWGLENRTGAQKSFPQEMIRLFLLPRENARVTEKGLRVKGQYFTADILERLNWFSRARIGGVENRIVSIDPLSDARVVYLHASYDTEPELREFMSAVVRGIGIIPCRVIEHRGFEASVSWHELEQDAALRNELNQIDEQDQEPARRALKVEIDATVASQREATAQALKTQEPVSKRSRIAGIQVNRDSEKIIERQPYMSHQSQGAPQVDSSPATVAIHSPFPPSTSDALDAAMSSAKARRSSQEEK